MITNSLFIIAGIFSLIALWFIVAAMKISPHANQYQHRINLLVGGSILCTLIAILEQGFIGQTGLILTLSTVAGFTTLMVQNLYLIGIWQHGVRGLGLLLLPLTALPLFALGFLPEASANQWVAAHSFLQTGHLLLSVVGYAILTLAAMYACMQLFLDRALKKKQFGFFVRSMPPLMDVSNYLFSHVRWATWLIGLSILTGLAWQWVAMKHFALFNHKVLLAIIAWATLFILNHMRRKASWHHQRASRMVLAAYIVLMLAYFGVKLIRQSLV